MTVKQIGIAKEFNTVELIGVSGDTKPLAYGVGSMFYETDTKKTYLFDGTAWQDFTQSSSSGATAMSTLKAEYPSSTNLTVIKNSGGTLLNLTAVNMGGSIIYLKLFNKATTPVLGTDVPVLTFLLNTGGTPLQVSFANGGSKFSNGIAFASTNSIGNTDTTPAQTNFKVDINYI